MTEKDLWKYLWDKKVARSKPFDRDLIWVSKEDFWQVKQFFFKEYNILHPDTSYRSKGLFRHLHALDEGEEYEIHKDFGNIARFFPLGIFHLFFDVIPYYILKWVKGVPMDKIFERPR